MRLKTAGLLFLLVVLNIGVYRLWNPPDEPMDKARTVAQSHIRELDEYELQAAQIRQTAKNINLVLGEIDRTIKRGEDIRIDIVKDFLLSHASGQSADFQTLSAHYEQVCDEFVRQIGEFNALLEREAGQPQPAVSQKAYLAHLNALLKQLIVLQKSLAGRLSYLENTEELMILQYSLVKIATPTLKAQIYVFAYRPL